jgi:hypothetical protein
MEVESIGLIFIAMGMKIGMINIVRAMYSIEYNPTKIPWSLHTRVADCIFTHDTRRYVGASVKYQYLGLSGPNRIGMPMWMLSKSR